MKTVVTINIRHGGGTTDRVDALVTRMLGYDADMLVVSEFRANANGARLQAALERSGYATSHPVAAPRQNSVLIASRWPIERSWAFSQTLESHHLWCAATTEMAICGVYMPQGAAKVSYWESLIQHGVGSGIDLFIGDFNTGNNDLDKDPGGTKFYGPELPGRFIGTGYIDIWRARHPRTREYSWFSPTKANNGFRLDHAYARPGLNERVVSCEFDHTPRLLNETDHSALIVSIASD